MGRFTIGNTAPRIARYSVLIALITASATMPPVGASPASAAEGINLTTQDVAAIQEAIFTEAGLVDGAGNRFLLDTAKNRVLKVDTAGTVTIVAGNGTAGYSGDGGPADQAALNNPTDVAIDDQGNLLIADFGNNRVRKVNSDGTISTLAGTGMPGNSGDGGSATSAAIFPLGVNFDADGNVVVLGPCLDRKIDRTTGIICSLVNGESSCSHVSGPDNICDVANR